MNPLPLDQAAADTDILVGIDVNGDPSEQLTKTNHNIVDVWFGSAQIMMHSLTAHMMAAYPPDVYARPHVSAFGALEFWRVRADRRACRKGQGQLQARAGAAGGGVHPACGAVE